MNQKMTRTSTYIQLLQALRAKFFQASEVNGNADTHLKTASSIIDRTPVNFFNKFPPLCI